MKKLQEQLYIFSNGRIAKINSSNGEIIWEVKLKQYGLQMCTVGSLKAENNKVYFGGNGKLLCLNEKDGSLVWKNDLKGWGYSYVIFANNDINEALVSSGKATLISGNAAT